ncbi:MAG: PTS sugar transporter subunit IIC [bacterium]|nr:PTS sugar transporter subunit IIC [bacterium]
MEHWFIIKYSIITALLALDVYNVFLSGVSRPIVTSAILGLLLNNLYLGIFIGCIIELILINLIPIGAFIPPNGTIVTGIAIILTFYFHIYKTGALLPVIILYSMFWGHLTKRMVKAVWKRNTVLVEHFLKKLQKGRIEFTVYNLHSLSFDYVLFLISVLLGSYIGILLFRYIIRIFIVSFYINIILENALFFLPLLAFSYLLNSFDVHFKSVFIVIGILASFFLNFFIKQPLLIFIPLGLFSYSVLLILYRLKMYRYEL